MINTEEFSKRLQKVIDFYSESASSFAQKIEVQRSSISHILSGRNKPSLDFVLKILDAYPEVELYWLLNGKGQFPKSSDVEKNNSTLPTSKNESDLFSSTQEEKKIVSPQNLNSTSTSSEIENFKHLRNSSGKQIERIVIFYKDGSFSNFENS
ncbi:helix-turn-helix domain-containing protein [Aurantibacter aestuarii]|uniref:Transcriptional regulator n=1 Tax=Aurantibacter aestuarii TaxID=1266046 RepID=A0A2T1N8F5_9FLAO|nr:helix-turn-helix transcriptional regulator [Aurantibacter aestuarii]PSG88122.1 transcriptional regulator [Aurantibacter aestuarii]